jgi:hypothetical protein
MQLTAGIFRKIQAYDRVDAQGAGEKKTVFIVAPSAALMVGPVSGVKVSAQIGLSASQKYVAHVLFEGGELLPSSEFLAFLSTVKEVTRL